MGLFSDDPSFDGFLRRIGKDPSRPEALVARNFRLDEGVNPFRYDSYADVGGVKDHGDYGQWATVHGDYLKRRVFVPGKDDGPPRIVDPADPDTCPETFRRIDADSPFLHSDPRLHVIRMERVGFIADSIGEDPARIQSLAAQVVAGGHVRDDAYQKLTDVLKEWSVNIELRPIFAAYWDDVEGLFRATPAEDPPGWADTLRDRLGLAHYDPAVRGRTAIDVVVFKYPVAAIPRMAGLARELRPLVPPTVLDGSHSPAFCPAPYNQLTGHTVNLDRDDLSTDPPREVLHPAVVFTSENVWRVGQIRRNVNRGWLADVRGWHLLCVRELTGRTDYAGHTDGDLLGGP
jgi:hypothetical protein